MLLSDLLTEGTGISSTLARQQHVTAQLWYGGLLEASYGLLQLLLSFHSMSVRSRQLLVAMRQIVFLICALL